MRGARPLAVLLILSMLSACAGRQTSAPDLENAGELPGAHNPFPDYVDESDLDTAYLDQLRDKRELASTRHGGDRRGYDEQQTAHFHEEPTPGEKAFAETALLITGSVFLCTFVVVVLNGACEFGAHAGYYY